jgi:hypothetical protein
MFFGKAFLAALAISLTLYACKTDESEVFKDVISYNEAVLHKKVSNCTIQDNDASCGHKTESYIIECEGSEEWYKWDKSTVHQGGVAVYTIPKYFDSYQCNPGLNFKKQFRAHEKGPKGWEPNNYTEE